MKPALIRNLSLVVTGVLLLGCATMPHGPSVMVLPPTDKPFDLFLAEDASCRSWAARRLGFSPQEVADQNVASGAAVGTAVGAMIGATLGAASGHAGEGALIGAGSGMLIGAGEGAESGRVYGDEAQRRYDIAYQQCMYANGNLLPGMIRRHRSLPPPPDEYPPGPGPAPFYPPPPPPPPPASPGRR